MPRGWICTLGCLIFLLAASLAGAAEMELFKAERFQGGPWWLRADKLTYDATNHLFSAQGHVEIRQGDRRITAEEVQVNEQTKVAWVKGNVVMVLDEDIFTGQEGRFNLATGGGEMQGARLFLKTNHFHVTSPLIRKTGDNTYYAEEARVTTCDADRPVWSFATRKLSVVVEGYATGRGTSFKLGGVPVLYLPFTVLPVATKRQTGFLLPSYGQHKAGGTVVELPFYWAIDNSADATLFQTYLTNRGYMQGAEYRRQGHGDAGATFRGFYLSDHENRNILTPHRYWVAGMVNQPLPEDWNLRLTLDRVSDAAYLKDFNFGYMGLNRYSRELLRDYGRDLEQEEVNARVSTLLLSRNFALANLTAYGRYYDRLNPEDPRLFHRLPGISLMSVPLRVGNLPLYLGLDSSYNYFYQAHGMTGDRLDFHPRMWLQGQPLPGVAFDSRVGFRETLFRVDHTTPSGPPEQYLSRQLFDSRVGLSGAWARDYGREAGSSQFLRHVVRPEVHYWNIPRFAPGRYPSFDPLDLGWVARVNRNLPVREGDDPVGGVNALTYGISNSMLRRGENSQGQATVRDLVWLRLSQSAFFNRSSMGLDGTPQRHHPVSDFWGEVEVYPLSQLSLGMNMGVSPYQEGFDRADFKVTFMDTQRQNYLDVNYIFVKDFAKQINVSTYLNLMRSVKTWITYGHTFETDKKLEQRYGLILQRQCWGVALSYTERPDDKRVGFTLFIPGLGEKLKRSPVRFPEEGKQKGEGPDLF
ncbi:MAG: LPS assembly protein LptD [Pseudomonadota bacterium]